MWGKVDDRLWGSAKWLATPARGRALWVTALSWCSGQLTDGFVPEHVLPVLGATRADARALVTAGLWHDADGGWVFHDWSDYQPDAASVRALRSSRSSSGKEGNHARWHARRGIKVDGCEFCDPDPLPGNVRRLSDR